MRRLMLVFAVMGCEAKPGQPPASTSSASPMVAAIRQATACGDEVVGEEGIGQLRIGATVESVRQRCRIVRDTTVQDAEGMPQRKVAVELSRDTVEAEIVSGRVWRIVVWSPRLRTVDSLGVGTDIVRLLRLKNPRGMAGEGAFFIASPEHCGMSFRLALAGDARYRGDLDKVGLARLPASTVVSEVLVFGCHLGPQ
ncbi:MAG TPA: hypothetical protein VGQ98_05805 [Gemmatimonadaceae bacterium]|nr:hypothetical protein [Gemmatimonadaceae bacterium]